MSHEGERGGLAPCVGRAAVMSLHEWRGGGLSVRSAAVGSHARGGARALGTAETNGAAPSSWRLPGAVGLRRRFVASGGGAAAKAADTPRKDVLDGPPRSSRCLHVVRTRASAP